jgi:hypothetical protein
MPRLALNVCVPERFCGALVLRVHEMQRMAATGPTDSDKWAKASAAYEVQYEECYEPYGPGPPGWLSALSIFLS